MTSAAHSDYAGNGFAYDQYPLTGAFGTALQVLIGMTAIATSGPPAGIGGAEAYLNLGTVSEQVRAQIATNPYPNGPLGAMGGIFDFAWTVTIAQVSDGTSNTYLCGEKYLDANHYSDGLDQGDQWCDYTGYGVDMIRFVCSEDNLPNSGYCPRQDCAGFNDHREFGSAHAGMCNMAFCDGSVHQISYGIAATIHQQLGNRADGQAIDASMY